MYAVVNTSKTKQFIKECIIARRFIHPNMRNLIDVNYEAIPLMILPFMHNGDIKSFVKSKGDCIRSHWVSWGTYMHSELLRICEL